MDRDAADSCAAAERPPGADHGLATVVAATISHNTHVCAPGSRQRRSSLGATLPSFLEYSTEDQRAGYQAILATENYLSVTVHSGHSTRLHTAVCMSCMYDV